MEIPQHPTPQTLRPSSPDGTPLVTVEHVTRTYDAGTPTEVMALHNIDIDIYEGEFIAITGSSGSGKSTLLHILGLLDLPTSGILRFGGVDVQSLTDRKRTDLRLRFISFVFQFFNLIDSYTALGNIMLQLELQGHPPKEARARSLRILEFLDMADKAEHFPSELSGGQQQRIAIGRALAKDSKIILADEPTAHLDSKNSQHILDLLRKVNRDFRRTVVIVTHEPSQAAQADRIIVLKDGILEKNALSDTRLLL